MLFSPMKFNPRSLIFISILIAIFTFLLGVRIGKKIEQINTLNTVPVKNKNPTSAPTAFALKKYVASACGFQFLYPAAFKESEEASDEAKFIYHTSIITILCDSTSKMKKFLNQKNQLKVEGTRVADSVEMTLYPSEVINTSYVYFIHPESKKATLMRIPHDLLDLFENTVQFL